MTREELEHVLCAAAAIASENSLVVAGCQAVPLAFPNAAAALLVSREVDIYPALHPERAELIDRAIGALSSFDETFGYHADGVGSETAVAPSDWIDRASLHYIGHDYVQVLLKERMIDIRTLQTRMASLVASRFPVATVSARAQRRAAEAAA
jgi:hypothetical protein